MHIRQHCLQVTGNTSIAGGKLKHRKWSPVSEVQLLKQDCELLSRFLTIVKIVLYGAIWAIKGLVIYQEAEYEVIHMNGGANTDFPGISFRCLGQRQQLFHSAFLTTKVRPPAAMKTHRQSNMKCLHPTIYVFLKNKIGCDWRDGSKKKRSRVNMSAYASLAYCSGMNVSP